MEEFIIFVGVPILILGFVFLSLHLDKKRTEDLKALASKISYRFSEESWSILQRFFRLCHSSIREDLGEVKIF